MGNFYYFFRPSSQIFRNSADFLANFRATNEFLANFRGTHEFLGIHICAVGVPADAITVVG